MPNSGADFGVTLAAAVINVAAKASTNSIRLNQEEARYCAARCLLGVKRTWRGLVAIIGQFLAGWRTGGGFEIRLSRDDISRSGPPARGSEEWGARSVVRFHQRLREYPSDGKQFLGREVDQIAPNRMANRNPHGRDLSANACTAKDGPSRVSAIIDLGNAALMRRFQKERV
jgi:hypothetical protein